MSNPSQAIPWTSFCISTFKRPALLTTQLELLLKQSDPNFEIVISDNDELGSAEAVAAGFGDQRIRYFKNEVNLGMIRSFNLSIERARTPYIVMVTDDDPIQTDFLEKIKPLLQQYPDRSLYGGFVRRMAKENEVEIVESKNILKEILDPARTKSLLWSSCVLDRNDTLAAGNIPEFGSPHLADHALLVLVGSQRGAVVVNKMYSRLTIHDTNFSKLNFDTYVKGCEGFYNNMNSFIEKSSMVAENKHALDAHLKRWFISCVFNLKKYYAVQRNTNMLSQVKEFSEKILSFEFMAHSKLKFWIKESLFKVKLAIGYFRV